MRAALRRIEAGDGVGEGGLAAAVGADQAEDLAALDPHIDAVQRDDAAEAPLDGPAFEHRPGVFTSKNQPVSSRVVDVLARTPLRPAVSCC